MVLGMVDDGGLGFQPREGGLGGRRRPGACPTEQLRRKRRPNGGSEPQPPERRLRPGLAAPQCLEIVAGWEEFDRV
jgi:hypothetical protein